MRALVIDDSKTMRIFLKKVLRDLGFEVFEADNGLSALELMKQDEKMGLVLVDWNMPVMDGYEFVRAVRSQAGNEEVKLMMVTSETQADGIDRIAEAGADGYLTKPVTPQALAEKIGHFQLKGA